MHASGRPRNLLIVALALAAAATAQAQTSPLNFANMFRSTVVEQTGDATVEQVGSFFSTSVTATDQQAAPSGPLTVPTTPASSQTLSTSDNTYYAYSSGFFATTADMNAAFPTGTYGYVVGANTATLEYGADFYPSQASLSGSSFSLLQDIDPSQAAVLTFTPLVAGPGVSQSLVFFNILDLATDSYVVNDMFLPATTTGRTIAADTLVAGREYVFELTYSNRVDVASTGTNFLGQIGYDTRVFGHFTAAAPVPEASTLLLILAGGLPLAWRIHRDQRASHPSRALR